MSIVTTIWQTIQCKEQFLQRRIRSARNLVSDDDRCAMEDLFARTGPRDILARINTCARGDQLLREVAARTPGARLILLGGYTHTRNFASVLYDMIARDTSPIGDDAACQLILCASHCWCA